MTNAWSVAVAPQTQNLEVINYIIPLIAIFMMYRQKLWIRLQIDTTALTDEIVKSLHCTKEGCSIIPMSRQIAWLGHYR